MMVAAGHLTSGMIVRRFGGQCDEVVAVTPMRDTPNVVRVQFTSTHHGTSAHWGDYLFEVISCP